MKLWEIEVIVREPVRKNVYRGIHHTAIVEAETRKQARALAPQHFPGINLTSDKVKVIVHAR